MGHNVLTDTQVKILERFIENYKKFGMNICGCDIERLLDYEKEFSLMEHGETKSTMDEDLYRCVPLLQIKLDDINSVPEVYYNGDKIDKKVRVSFDWKTREDVYDYNSPYIHVEYADFKEEIDYCGTKTIQHNHPFKMDKQLMSNDI